MTITAERLRELASYDPNTGLLQWRESKGAAKAGKPLGGTHRRHGYCETMIDGGRYPTHRLVWLYHHGVMPSGHIDHINGDPDDNRIENLRDVSVMVNRQNIKRAYKSKRRGLLGAHFNKASGKWAAAICVNYKQIHLGFFATAEDAHAAYLAAKRRLHEGCTI